MNEAELLFTEILNCRRHELYLNKETVLDSDQKHLISQALKRRMRGEPIQYVLGKTEFRGLEFIVDRNVFIPRPETEILVETVISYVFCLSTHSCQILELGTGSGCIAISLAKHLPFSYITATDIYQQVLDIAKKNAEIHAVDGRIRLLKSNLFLSLSPLERQYEICVCNPPYISTSEIRYLSCEVQYEPQISLDGGRDGLEFYRKIISDSPAYLKRGGFLIMEMGCNQYQGIEEAFRQLGAFKIIEVVKDYNHIDRVVVAQHV